MDETWIFTEGQHLLGLGLKLVAAGVQFSAAGSIVCVCIYIYIRSPLPLEIVFWGARAPQFVLLFFFGLRAKLLKLLVCFCSAFDGFI